MTTPPMIQPRRLAHSRNQMFQAYMIVSGQQPDRGKRLQSNIEALDRYAHTHYRIDQRGVYVIWSWLYFCRSLVRLHETV